MACGHLPARGPPHWSSSERQRACRDPRRRLAVALRPPVENFSKIDGPRTVHTPRHRGARWENERMFEVDAMGQPVVVEDLDADWLLALLEEKKYAAREVERAKLRLAAQWCVLHPATADTGVATWAGDALPGVLHQDESLGGDGHPRGLRVRPGTGRRRPRGVHADRDEADRRRPRPPAPAAEDLAARRGPGGGAVEGPPGRPGHPRVVQGRRGVRGRPARPQAGLLRVRRDPDDGRDGDRQVPPRAPRADARSRAARVGTSPCGTPPPATSTAPATSTWPATPST